MPKVPSSSYTSSRRWSPAHARAALAAAARSGLSLREFAVREGLEAQRLERWRRKISASTSTATRTPAQPVFVEVSPRPAAVVEVVLRCGRVLRVCESVEPAALRRLADALDDGAPC